MAGKKDFKALEKRLARLGFRYDHQNASSQFVYTHDRHPDLAVSPGINDGAAKILLRKVEKALDCQALTPKRNAQAIKDRQARSRESLRADDARLEAERAAILRQKDAVFSGAGSYLSADEVLALEARIREIDRERREIERLMGAPVSGTHLERSARHEGGRR